MSELKQLLNNIKDVKHPPVHLWKPDFCGDINILINAQGEWLHDGALIHRNKLVKLFASILWCEEDNYYLVTPVEKMRIEVEDVPFVVVSAALVDGQWIITTNVLDQFVIGEEHKVELRLFHSVWIPYVYIRYGLWARASRNVYAQWVNEAIDKEDHQQSELSLTSGNYQFSIAKE